MLLECLLLKNNVKNYLNKINQHPLFSNIGEGRKGYKQLD